MAGYRDRLKASESGGRSNVVNAQGYTGLYQWGPALLSDYNRATGQNLTMDQFAASPDIQERAQDWADARSDAALAPYVGAVVNGQTLDQDALRAMAHLGGIGGARRYVTSGGSYNPADANGTSLSDYAAKFGGGSASGATQPAMNALASVATTEAPQRNALAQFELLQSLQPQYNALSLTPYKMT